MKTGHSAFFSFLLPTMLSPIVESNEAEQATHSLGKSIPAPSSYFLILHVFKK